MLQSFISRKREINFVSKASVRKKRTIKTEYRSYINDINRKHVTNNSIPKVNYESNMQE